MPAQAGIQAGDGVLRTPIPRHLDAPVRGHDNHPSICPLDFLKRQEILPPEKGPP
jgi:hypothetical protein